MMSHMLRGELVGLRARHKADVPILEDELLADADAMARTIGWPWRPLPPGSDASPFRFDPPIETTATFSVIDLDGAALAGVAVLRDIDSYHRSAHIGVALRPAFRGRGPGTDIVRVLCRYAFVTLGLHRVQAQTMTDNEAMIKTAEHAGFTREGILRKPVWANGGFSDMVVFGVLADEWAQQHAVA
jgi:RimJ/RimL family protein N-acetyltransferase